MVGHLAASNWVYPGSNKLLIVKSGGCDPDAFKEPIAFECIWSADIQQESHGVIKAVFKKGTNLVITTSNIIIHKDPHHNDPKAGSFWRAIPPRYILLCVYYTKS